MSTFGAQLSTFLPLANARTQDVFDASVEHVHKSITDGSALTGAPGQPVDTGYLKGSWIVEIVSSTLRRITTNVAYAPVIEHGEREQFAPEGTSRPPNLKSTRQPGAGGSTRSTVGGMHSVAQTRTGWPRIVDASAREQGAR